MKDPNLSIAAAIHFPSGGKEQNVIPPSGAVANAVLSTPVLPIPDSATASSIVISLRMGILHFGRDLLVGDQMVPLFQFVQRLRVSMGQRWPNISDAAACMMLKANMKCWSDDWELRAPTTPCDPQTGWIVRRVAAPEFSEIYLG